MKTIKTLLVLGLVVFTTQIFGQTLNETYQATLNEIVINFESIRTGNSLQKGKTTIRVRKETQVTLQVKHNKQIKNLTFEKKLNEDNELKWQALNQITKDMVKKHDEFLSETLEEMRAYSAEKAKE